MGTKVNPSLYDCYEKAHPHEPIFTLRAHDPDAPMIVKMWAFFRLQQINAGVRPKTERDQVSEALRIATEMEVWKREEDNRDDLAELGPVNHEGYPLTGPHAIKDKNSTSGATD